MKALIYEMKENNRLDNDGNVSESRWMDGGELTIVRYRRKPLSELCIPHKNSTFCRPDAQLSVELQEAKIKPCRRGKDVSPPYRTLSKRVGVYQAKNPP